MKKRAYTAEYKEWRRLVLDKCGSKCVRCGSFQDPHCHHIQGWAKYPSLRFKVDNGEVLCKECHHKEHPFMAELERKSIVKKIKQQSNLKTRQLKKKLKREARRKRKAIRDIIHHRQMRELRQLLVKQDQLNKEMSDRLELVNT